MQASTPFQNILHARIATSYQQNSSGRMRCRTGLTSPTSPTSQWNYEWLWVMFPLNTRRCT